MKSIVPLRLGLGLVYLYSSISILRNPIEWEWAVRQLPKFFQNSIDGIGILVFLRIQGVVELIFSLGLLLWFLPKKATRLVAGLAAIQMTGILLLVGIDGVTFRDLGLLGGLVAVFIMSR